MFYIIRPTVSSGYIAVSESQLESFDEPFLVSDPIPTLAEAWAVIKAEREDPEYDVDTTEEDNEWIS